MANRGNGPDHVLQIAYERAPNGFKHIHDIISEEELEAIGSGYKAIAGFEVEKVNQLAEQSEGTAQRLGLKSPAAWTSKNQDSPTANGIQRPTPDRKFADGVESTAVGVNGSVVVDP